MNDIHQKGRPDDRRGPTSLAHWAPRESSACGAYERFAERAHNMVVASEAWMHNGGDALAGVLRHASRQTLAGQTHMVDPMVLAPAIIDLFKK